MELPGPWSPHQNADIHTFLSPLEGLPTPPRLPSPGNTIFPSGASPELSPAHAPGATKPPLANPATPTPLEIASILPPERGMGWGFAMRRGAAPLPLAKKTQTPFPARTPSPIQRCHNFEQLSAGKRPRLPLPPPQHAYFFLQKRHSIPANNPLQACKCKIRGERRMPRGDGSPARAQSERASQPHFRTGLGRNAAIAGGGREKGGSRLRSPFPPLFKKRVASLRRGSRRGSPSSRCSPALPPRHGTSPHLASPHKQTPTTPTPGPAARQAGG